MIYLKCFFYITIIALSSCEKKIQHTPATQTSKGAIDALQRYYVSTLDPYSISLGQSVHVIETQEIIASQAPIKQLSKEWTIDVTEVENFEDERLLTVMKKVTDKLFDEFFIYEFKNVYSLPQLQTQKNVNPLGIKSDSLYKLFEDIKQHASEEETTVTGIAYQNLKTRLVTLVPPKKVQEDKNCQNLPNCRINANLITYDIAFQFSNGNEQTINVEWYLSTEVPYFAGLLKQCTTTIVSIDTARALVKQCSEVIDFKN